MKGIEWILKERKKYGIRIVNISVGTNPGLAKKQKELLLDAVELLWDTGLTVVVSAETTDRRRERWQFRETAEK